ncbi:ATP-binding protein [Holdemanella sp. MSK.7.32]|uniref:ATP-binding protein n=1 Tax=Holdemanella sp. MSK.7.32 TaxID=2965273 RepID=UPI00351F9862
MVIFEHIEYNTSSQYSLDGWHQLLKGGPIADAILDRIINSFYLFTLHGKSLRETYSKLKDMKYQKNAVDRVF